MRNSIFTLIGLSVLAIAIGLPSHPSASHLALSPSPSAPGTAHAAPMTAADARAALGGTCLPCHDDDKQKGELTLEKFDPAKAEQNADVAEKMIRKLRAGMMPPPEADRRPAETVSDAFASMLEAKLDAAAEAHPNPGRRTF